MQNRARASFPSLTSLLKISTTSFHLQQVHAQIVRRGLEQDHVLISQLMVSLSKTHLSGLEDHFSTWVFDRVVRPGTGLWNVLVKGFVEKGRFSEAVSAFVRMKREDCFADGFTYPLLIKLCASDVRVREGRAFHGSALRCGFVDSDVFVRTSLIDFYGKCDDVVSARKLFDEMPHRNVVSWTAMVVGYVASGDLVEAKNLFDEMPLRNSITWNAMIDGFVKSGDLCTARRIFDEMPEKNAVSFATMIDGYAKSGDMSSARFLFDRASNKDNFALSALISGYAQNGQLAEAITVFSDSGIEPDEHVVVSLISACSKEGDPELAKWVDDHVSKIPIDLGRAHVNAALIDMNAKCGNLERAKELFEQTPNRDMVSYCSMIHGLSIHGRGREAVSLFNRMVEDGLVPDDVAYTVVLTACSRAGLVAEGLRYFEILTNDQCSVVASPEHYSVIVDLLGRSGDLKTGYELLRSRPVGPRAGAWAALLGACRLHGDAELGEIVAARLLEAELLSPGNYVLLSQMYAERERWLDVSIVWDRMKEKGVRKLPGCSWMTSTQG